jgi:hypothetical protein
MAIGSPDPSRTYRGDMPLVDTVHKIWRGLRINVSGHAMLAAIQLRLFGKWVRTRRTATCKRPQDPSN